ncbi:hypothetical protein [Thermus phage P23-45]|uniref:Uncharacterized protein n=1 Tax=Thermus virus P23-45 TaxID=2914006 RepID=A7XX62_BP234|nr:hypothetical protein P23p37 [Thermus phage P23-45]ABU96870.1 hypothetical protein P23p37 [Thermus phage P23-45]UYB98437.1 hypothetical protein [Thermus phage P23-45]
MQNVLQQEVKQVQDKPDVFAQAREMAGTAESALNAVVSAAQNNALFKAAERLAQGEPVTLKELFWDGRAVNIFGEVYPDLPTFDQPLDQKTAEAIVRRYVSTVKALSTAEKRLSKFNETFQKKMLKRAKALARMVKGSSVLRRQFLQTLRAEDLEPFTGDGDYANKLIFSRGATLHVNYTEVFPLEGAFLHASSQADAVSYLTALASSVLDHTEAFYLATGSKPKRSLTLTLTAAGKRYVFKVENNKPLPVQVEDTLVTNQELKVELSYAIKIAKGALDPSLEALESVKLPVYRTNFHGLLISAFRNEEQEAEEEEVVF